VSDLLTAVEDYLDRAEEEGKAVDPDLCWLGVVAEGGAFGLLPISPEMLPATVQNGSYNLITGDLADAMGLEGEHSLYDTDAAIERLHAGHFKPVQLGNGKTINYATLRLRKSPTLGAP
jgi:hypothetical protein